jgi:hypothetical protein
LTEFAAALLVVMLLGGPLFLLLLDWIAGRIDEREAQHDQQPT